MRIIGIVGTKNTGKTVLVTNIVKKLVERGFDVGTVKHTTEGFDIEDRDTWKHKEAGAQVVVGSGDETFLNIGETMELDLIFNLMKYVKELDFVVVEGFKHSRYAKISTSDYKDDLTIKNVDVRDLKPADIESLVDMIENRSFGIYQSLNCKKCGFESCDAFQKAKISGDASKDVKCETEDDNVVLKVDGFAIPMNPFVKSLVKNVVRGMVDSLRKDEYGAHETKRIELLINDEDN
ncbi:molybdopterin-guanine dinucleotide biosynthesis protein B [Methanobacterium sp. SMA-27]|uniref:molybdopterin-guanine dinucleotide biosynthesis protein B n=1 Tax=Methanobacterium sp. SMA-27 TaxID=1495336 RepID=UPI00064F31E8|nr:molybdopterin-guanine dinucleotide biosynthesis protein B [Methanobacterium sp. SMA-27]